MFPLHIFTHFETKYRKAMSIPMDFLFWLSIATRLNPHSDAESEFKHDYSASDQAAD